MFEEVEVFNWFKHCTLYTHIKTSHYPINIFIFMYQLRFLNKIFTMACLVHCPPSGLSLLLRLFYSSSYTGLSAVPQTSQASSFGTFHFLFPWPGILFPGISTWFTLLLLSGLGLSPTSVERPSMSTWPHYTILFYLLHIAVSNQILLIHLFYKFTTFFLDQEGPYFIYCC